MRIKHFLETNDNFTKEELEIFLDLLDIVKDSLFDSTDKLLSAMINANDEESKTIDVEFWNNQRRLLICIKFCHLLDDYIFDKKWGKYLK